MSLYKKLAHLLKNDLVFFAGLFLFVIALFKQAFLIKFFQDDFFFLKISNAKTIRDFISFFSPIRTYSYKPLATEVFYFFIRTLRFNTFLGHTFVFFVYFVGIIFLYKIIYQLSNNRLFSRLVVFLYALSFIHVFQLYWFATFQEVMVFTCLILSFYFYKNKKPLLNILFFTAALLSKETAMLFIVFLTVFELVFEQKTIKKKLPLIIVNIFIGIIFLFIYKYSLKNVTSLDNYKLQFNNPKLMINNSMWYLLWSFGLPNFMSDVFRSFPLQPLPDFWKAFATLDFKIYFYILITYYSIFLVTLIAYITRYKNRINRILKNCFYFLSGFFIFLGPILLFSHKWMVRLTLPLIFIVSLQAYLVFMFLSAKEKIFKLLSNMLIILFIIWNFYGTKVHESSSVYTLENRIVTNASIYFSQHKKEIIKHKYLFFYDINKKKKPDSPWGGSEKLKNTFWDQYFIEYYFPENKIKAIYYFENKKTPEDSFVVLSRDILLLKQ